MPDYTYGQTLMIRSSNSGFFKEEVGTFVYFLQKFRFSTIRFNWLYGPCRTYKKR